jgi:hypothetical protein
MCSDIITVDEAILLVLCLRVCEARGEGPHYKLPRDVHLLMVIYSHHDNPLLILLPINKMHTPKNTQTHHPILHHLLQNLFLFFQFCGFPSINMDQFIGLQFIKIYSWRRLNINEVGFIFLILFDQALYSLLQKVEKEKETAFLKDCLNPLDRLQPYRNLVCSNFQNAR